MGLATHPMGRLPRCGERSWQRPVSTADFRTLASDGKLLVSTLRSCRDWATFSKRPVPLPSCRETRR